MDIYSFKLSTWNLNMDCIIDDSVELTLNSLVVIMVLWLYRRMPLILRRYMMKYIGIKQYNICNIFLNYSAKINNKIGRW